MKCKQCGFEIVKGGRPANEAAQDRGFCGAGCREVAEKLNELNERAALEAR